jgi:RimJ/RimL family protein N-acetyltransferase
VAEKAGATAEGILRRRVKIAGHVHDAIMYSLVRGDR